MMIVFASHETQKDRYEDIARAIYGEKVANITSILNFVCLIGFVSSYVVFVKSAMSQIISTVISPKSNWYTLLTYDLDPTGKKVRGSGDHFWGFFYSFCILLPMSLPR